MRRERMKREGGKREKRASGERRGRKRGGGGGRVGRKSGGEGGVFITRAPAAYNKGNRIRKKKKVWAGRMRLYGEILKKIGGEDLFGGARYTVLPGRGGYFQGVRTVGEFSPSRVILGFRRAVLEIEGSGFVIEKYCDGDLELSGNIVSVRLSDGTR